MESQTSEQVRPRQGQKSAILGRRLHWRLSTGFFAFSPVFVYVQFSKTSPLKSGESSEKSSGENRVKSCHVCGCHGFSRPETRVSKRAPRKFLNWRVQGNPLTANPSPTFRQPFADLLCQPLSKPLFPWAPGTRLETRVNGFLENAQEKEKKRPKWSHYIATSLAFYRSQKGLSLENSEKSLKRGSRGLSAPGSKRLKKSRKKVENEPKTRKQLEK